MTADEIARDKARCANWWKGYQFGRDDRPPEAEAPDSWQGGYEQGVRDAAELRANNGRGRVAKHDALSAQARRHRNQLEKEQAERDGRAAEEKAKGLAAVAEAAKTGKPEPLSVVCPQCSSGIGERCRNYVNARCAPHGERVRLAKAKELAARPAAGRVEPAAA
jgi:hypothetical protein